MFKKKAKTALEQRLPEAFYEEDLAIFRHETDETIAKPHLRRFRGLFSTAVAATGVAVVSVGATVGLLVEANEHLEPLLVPPGAAAELSPERAIEREVNNSRFSPAERPVTVEVLVGIRADWEAETENGRTRIPNTTNPILVRVAEEYYVAGQDLVSGNIVSRPLSSVKLRRVDLNTAPHVEDVHLGTNYVTDRFQRNDLGAHRPDLLGSEPMLASADTDITLAQILNG